MQIKNFSRLSVLLSFILLSACTTMTGAEALNVGYMKDDSMQLKVTDISIDIIKSGSSISLANNSEHPVFVPTSFSSNKIDQSFPLVWSEKCIFSNKSSISFFEYSAQSFHDGEFDEYVGFLTGLNFERLSGKSTMIIEIGDLESLGNCNQIFIELEVYSQSAINAVFGKEYGEIAEVLTVKIDSYIELLKYNQLLYSMFKGVVH